MPKRTDISSILVTSVIVIAALCSVAACARDERASVSQEMLDSITAECKAPAQWLGLRDDGSVEARLTPDADYEKVDCVLAGIRRNGVIDLGFVGNERVLP